MHIYKRTLYDLKCMSYICISPMNGNNMHACTTLFYNMS